jgi:hypothetical protein
VATLSLTQTEASASTSAVTAAAKALTTTTFEERKGRHPERSITLGADNDSMDYDALGAVDDNTTLGNEGGIFGVGTRGTGSSTLDTGSGVPSTDMGDSVGVLPAGDGDSAQDKADDGGNMRPCTGGNSDHGRRGQ